MELRFPVIDPEATGANILFLRKQLGYSVRDLQSWFHFDTPRAIYKWQKGETLPSVDNLYALSVLFQVPIENILVEKQTLMCNSDPQKQLSGTPAAAFHLLLWLWNTNKKHDEFIIVLIGSPGRTRTYNPSVNSRMLCH